jgi:hypothetical protein
MVVFEFVHVRACAPFLSAAIWQLSTAGDEPRIAQQRHELQELCLTSNASMCHCAMLLLQFVAGYAYFASTGELFASEAAAADKATRWALGTPLMEAAAALLPK